MFPLISKNRSGFYTFVYSSAACQRIVDSTRFAKSSWAHHHLHLAYRNCTSASRRNHCIDSLVKKTLNVSEVSQWTEVGMVLGPSRKQDSLIGLRFLVTAAAIHRQLAELESKRIWASLRIILHDAV